MPQPPHLITPEELAALTAALRQVKGWTQEQLADIFGLSVLAPA